MDCVGGGDLISVGLARGDTHRMAPSRYWVGYGHCTTSGTDDAEIIIIYVVVSPVVKEPHPEISPPIGLGLLGLRCRYHAQPIQQYCNVQVAFHVLFI